MPFYKAIKEGWDGRQIRKPGEVFPFDGPKGTWMVECDASGTLAKGEKAPAQQPPVRLGSSSSKNRSREDLRAECRKLGIPFKAVHSGADLAKLLADHAAAKEAGTSAPAPEGETGSADTGGKGGTGDQDVI